MKLSNFELTKVHGNNILEYIFIALVDVETGIFFKKVKRRKIFRKCMGSWRFSDNGRCTPLGVVGELEMAFEAEKGREIQHCLDKGE